MAVEKVTGKQASVDLQRSNIADTNSFNTEIKNPFLTGDKAVKLAVENGERYSVKNPLFGIGILEEPKVKEAALELPKANNSGAFSALSNLYKQVKYGVNAFDSTIDPFVKESLRHLPAEGDIKSALGPRAIAIMRQGGIILS